LSSRENGAGSEREMPTVEAFIIVRRASPLSLLLEPRPNPRVGSRTTSFDEEHCNAERFGSVVDGCAAGRYRTAVSLLLLKKIEAVTREGWRHSRSVTYFDRASPRGIHCRTVGLRMVEQRSAYLSATSLPTILLASHAQTRLCV